MITAASYTSDDVQISITTERIDDTDVYIADIQLSDPSKLLSGLADNSFRKPVAALLSA